MSEAIWQPRPVQIKGFKRDIVFGDKTKPPVVQSMLDTATEDVAASLRQIEALHKAGCELIRISVPNKKSLRGSEEIVADLTKNNIPHVLVADIHFAPHLALDSLDVFHKVRLNPGNYVEKNQGTSGILTDDEQNAILEKLRAKYDPVIEKAKSLERTLRIGVNHGSLGDRMVQTYGDTPIGMVESAMEYIEIALELGFDQMVVSLKASNVLQMLEANQLFVKEGTARDRQFPLHLGITEAGSGMPARLKSAQGIGYLLTKGVGETIRVSLAEDPAAEIPVALAIAETAHGLFERSGGTPVIPANFGDSIRPYKDVAVQSDPVIELGPELETESPADSDGAQPIRITLTEDELKNGDDGISGKPVAVAIASAEKLLDSTPKNLVVGNKNEAEVAFQLLQGARIKSFETEFIACPGCARTLFDLQTVTEKVKEVFSGVPNLKIAVMGCIVNGPGEMADADYGYVGAGRGRIDLYRGRDVVVKGIDPKDSLKKLAELIEGDHPEWEFPAAETTSLPLKTAAGASTFS